MRRLLVLGGTFVVALLGAQTAAAGEADIAVMQRIAARHFPNVTCPVAVTEGGVVTPQADAETDRQKCAINIQPWWREWPRSYLCGIVVHEYGHIAGLEHSPEPDSIMYAAVTREGIRSVPACRSFNDLERFHRRVQRLRPLLTELRSDFRDDRDRRTLADLRRTKRKLQAARRDVRRSKAVVALLLR